MHSRIYKGLVRHRRGAPAPHGFSYRLFMLYLDLDELPRLFDAVPLWSARRWAPARFKRGDYLGPVELPLDEAVRDLVQARLARRPRGPIRLLTHLRYFGCCFNPVSFYYCFDAAGERLDAIVAEITNTPWGERHAYVLDAARDTGRLKRFAFDKDFHVSPFMPMDLQYDWCFSPPARRLLVHMRNLQDGEPLFEATLALSGEPCDATALLRVLAGFPLMTARILLAIHWQALKLWLKKIPVYDHPLKSAKTVQKGSHATEHHSGAGRPG